MQTVTKTVKVIEKFVDEFNTTSWRAEMNMYNIKPGGSVDIVSCSTGETGIIPVSMEFLEELQKNNYSKFKMEISFVS